MIISDLIYFEVVAETTSIVVGGNQPSLWIANTLLKGIFGQLSSAIKIDSLITSGNQAASATAGSFNSEIAGQPIQGVISTSSANSY